LAKKDKIHFTPEGYVLNADLLFEAIKQSYGVYLNNQYQKEN
jgi:lysophospholipase L1-like esterase